MAKEKGTPKLQQTNELVHQKKLSKIVAELVHQKKCTKIIADCCTGLLYKAKIAADDHAFLKMTLKFTAFFPFF